MNFKLRDYQQPHFKRLLISSLDNNFAHDGSELGTGKTYVGAALVKAFEQETLVVAPISVLPSWKEALDGFAAKYYTLTNYEQVWRKFGANVKWGSGSFFRFHKKWPRIVFDEAHRCGGDTTINSKMLISAKRQESGILTLSGTIADTPLRMKAFGFASGLHELKDYTEFLLRCQCKPGTFGGWTFSRKQHPYILTGLQEELYAKGRGSRMRKADIPGFPKTQIEVRMMGSPDRQLCRMGEELLASYNERTVRALKIQADIKIEKKLAEEAGEEYEAGGKDLARIMLLRQALETAKVPMLIDMAEDALEESKVVIFCNFSQTIEELCRWAKKAGRTFGVIHGAQSKGIGSERERVVKAFQANELDFVFCNIAAGGVGVSLHDPVTQVMRTALICPTFSGIDLKQALGRVNRESGGFSRQFLVYFEDSYEGAIARNLRGKLDALDLINDGELNGVFKNAA